MNVQFVSEIVESGIETSCGHVFCAPCLIAWQEKEPNAPPFHCPTCRMLIPHVKSELSLAIKTDSVRPRQSEYDPLASDEESDCEEIPSRFPCVVKSIFCCSFSLITSALIAWFVSR